MKSADYDLKWAARWAAYAAALVLLLRVFGVLRDVAPGGGHAFMLVSAILNFVTYTAVLWVLALTARGIARLVRGRQSPSDHPERRAEDDAIRAQGQLFKPAPPEPD